MLLQHAGEQIAKACSHLSADGLGVGAVVAGLDWVRFPPLTEFGRYNQRVRSI